MTTEERAAYIAGALAVIDVARQAADALRAKLAEAPTRYNFAIEALDAVAEAGQIMIGKSDVGTEV